ncbi:MAG: hypothetical protein H0W48_01255 [Methylibium sp.]|nr:hypothetical protein [Methylibium sp.]MBA3623100.1 hypothetical protein [Methylibium sp.]
MAQSLDPGRQLLQFVAHAEQAYSDALKAWDGAANAAEHAIDKASGWGELMAAQNELLHDGLSRLIGTQVALVSSWFELQARLLQEAQHRAMDSSSDAAPDARSGRPVTPQARTQPSKVDPALWFEHGSAVMHALLRPWGIDLSERRPS